MKKLKEKLARVFEEGIETDSNSAIEHDLPQCVNGADDIHEEEKEAAEEGEEQSSLPALVTLPSLPCPVLITPDTSEKDHQAADLELTNNNLQIIHQAWQVKNLTVRDACLLIDKTHATIEHRRKTLNRQYGYQGDGSRGGKIQPLD